MHLVARARAEFARRMWIRWAVLVLATVGAGTLAARTIGGYEAARDAWGARTRVLIVVQTVAPGTELHAGLLDSVDVPVAVAGDAHLTIGVDELLADRPVAQQWIARGELLTRHDVAPSGALALELRRGERGVAVPLGLLPLAVGDAVDVVLDGTATTAGRIVALDRSDDALGRGGAGVAVVAVPRADAAGVAAGALESRVALLLSARPSPPPPG